jgi:hypothetical protein
MWCTFYSAYFAVLQGIARYLSALKLKGNSFLEVVDGWLSELEAQLQETMVYISDSLYRSKHPLLLCLLTDLHDLKFWFSEKLYD